MELDKPLLEAIRVLTTIKHNNEFSILVYDDIALCNRLEKENGAITLILDYFEKIKNSKPDDNVIRFE